MDTTSKWASVSSTFGNISIKRMRTPTGWLLRTEDGESLLYINDELGSWLIEDKLEFFSIPHSGRETLIRRAKIPGGWLLSLHTIKNVRVPKGEEVRIKNTELTFVPDPEWKWIINYSS